MLVAVTVRGGRRGDAFGRGDTLYAAQRASRTRGTDG